MAEAADFPLHEQVQRLFTLLNNRGIRYLLVGGVALLRYVDGRNTEDLDLILSVESLKQVPELSIVDQNTNFARARFDGLRVDLLFTANPLFALVEEHYATRHRFAEVDVKVATVEGLILLKLYALPALYRQRDGQRVAIYESDLQMLLVRHRPDMVPLLATVRRYVDDGAYSDLCTIVAETEQRIARLDRHSNPS